MDIYVYVNYLKLLVQRVERLKIQKLKRGSVRAEQIIVDFFAIDTRSSQSQ